MFPYKFSVIIPIYNSEEYLHLSIESLINQKFDFSQIEVLLINNGSVDNSEAVCLKYQEKYENVKYFSINENGVSNARNYGIEHAQGKYIMFLDSDDIYTPDTMSKVYKFFEKHYDETDIVTFKIVPYQNGVAKEAHYRYKYFNKTKIYDYEEQDNWFIIQTTVNICVKNKGENNVLFDTSLKMHEDQRYDMEVALEKRTIGFVSGPEYRYTQHLGSATNSKAHAYYVFEPTMAMWEALFERFDEVPHYIQALFINDIKWKMNRDILMPYHYDEAGYQNALDRVLKLLNKVDPKVILNFPMMNYQMKFFLIRLMDRSREVKLNTENKIILTLDDEIIHETDNFTITVQRMKLIDTVLYADFAMSQVALFFTDERPRFYIVKDGKREELPVSEEEFEFITGTGINAPRFVARLTLDITTVKEFYIEIECFGKTYNAKYEFITNAIFNARKVVNAVYYKDLCFKFVKRTGKYKTFKKNSPYGIYTQLAKFIWDCAYFLVRTNIKVLLNRWGKKLYKQKNPVWLYADVENVFDNAYMQFMHDVTIDDGVDRYYILHKENQDRLDELFPDVPRDKIVIAESKQHKGLFLNCNKIITGYSNLGNICPFGAATMRWYYDLINMEIVYLQHGILHASLRTMYAHNRCQVDRVVVSSHFELDNFTSSKYGYTEKELIKSGMPRYDFIKREREPENKILFGPSWRQNLVGALIDGKRETKDDVFQESDFYKATNEFLNDPRLAKILEDNDLYLDFKNHPNFACYNHLFTTASDRIRIIEDRTNMDEYKLMITDYSSMVFDAVYISCPILYFVPDYEQFRAGVSHGYRELDLPLEQGFGPLSETADDLFRNLEQYINSNFQPASLYKERMDGFFLSYDDNNRDRLYEEIK
mgnify:CR=1 FL=1